MSRPDQAARVDAGWELGQRPAAVAAGAEQVGISVISPVW
jgi:hypothetical protein